jgi:DNA-binding cell septation regulator SpoVG
MSETNRGMTGAHQISEVRIRPVPGGKDGLLAFASCRYHDVVLNDIAIRKDQTGHLYLSYPRKLSATGRPHPLHYPIDHQSAGGFEEAILGQLRRLLGGGKGSEQG